MKFGIVVFPGSNCDHDAYYSVTGNLGYSAEYLWHKDTTIPKDIDCIILPGGFSYGDYLRCGAIARFSPLMNEVIKFANNGGYIIGICNGFQILTESGLLPGTLLRNENLKFICKDVFLKVENNSTPFTNKFKSDSIIRIPIAHGEGNYYADDSTVEKLENENQIVFRYTNEKGVADKSFNPNGSINNIAGIISSNGRILGMMPHPERYCDDLLGCSDGTSVFQSIANNFIK
ncbi:phosphoribosylformylglycinamidine synthase subunit PurQ [Candidatus Kapaibacterium sp.]